MRQEDIGDSRGPEDISAPDNATLLQDRKTPLRKLQGNSRLSTFEITRRRQPDAKQLFGAEQSLARNDAQLIKATCIGSPRDDADPCPRGKTPCADLERRVVGQFGEQPGKPLVGARDISPQ